MADLHAAPVTHTPARRASHGWNAAEREHEHTDRGQREQPGGCQS